MRRAHPRANGYGVLGGGTELYKVPSRSLEPEKWIETTSYTPGGASGVHGSRAIVTKNSQFLVFNSPIDGRLARLDLATRELTGIKRSTPVPFVCGPFMWIDDWGGDMVDSVATNPIEGSLMWFRCGRRSPGELHFDSPRSHSTERDRK